MKYLRTKLIIVLTVLTVSGLAVLARLKAADSIDNGVALVGADFEPFRSDFNAAKDHVRAVLLVGPT